MQRVDSRLCALLTCVVFAINASHVVFARNVLFIDLNNAPAETKAIRETLSPDDRLHIVPSAKYIDERARGEVLRITAELERVNRESLDCTSFGRETCERHWTRLRELTLAREKYTAHYTYHALVEDIRTTAPTAGFDLLVISGHHSGGYFRGELAALSAADFVRIGHELRYELNPVRTLLLLGCETGTPQLMHDFFVRGFPLLQLIVGAEDNAPTRNEARNLSFIRKVISEEPRWSRARTFKEMTAHYRALRRETWPVSFLWQRQYFFSRDWLGEIAEMPESVRSVFKQGQLTSLATSLPLTNLQLTRTLAPASERIETSAQVSTQARIPANPNAPLLTPSEAIRVLFPHQ